eukprot:CAMPEP_0194732872 /NCGR_PEP_ID=MMETSP0296-20130528/63194_1 /TAXON_ID=39354 /ORGANISM="Heterosigma akashiwo, Strain CCMP2393" /LENGTH=79 /DNA_ID=CAMNT_0039640959 /DNA_START=35 /DNA_END=275 /DNA_ORIENTATION=-
MAKAFSTAAWRPPQPKVEGQLHHPHLLFATWAGGPHVPAQHATGCPTSMDTLPLCSARLRAACRLCSSLEALDELAKDL